MTKTSGPARLVAVLCIIFGIVAVGGGVTTWAMVTTQLSAENITVPKDSPLVPGAKVQDPISAYAQAEIINHHALNASGGKTYAELGALITEARTAGDTAKAVVRILAEVRTRTKDERGEGVDDRRTAELWTFEREVKSTDPNWHLSFVAAAEA